MHGSLLVGCRGLANHLNDPKNKCANCGYQFSFDIVASVSGLTLRRCKDILFGITWATLSLCIPGRKCIFGKYSVF